MTKKCKNSSDSCGIILSSNCVDYSGQELKSIGKEVDQCNLTVSDVAELIDKELKKLKDGLDTKKIAKLCINSIDKEDTIVLVINKLITEICSLTKELEDTKQSLKEIDVLSSIVDIDSNCLSGTHCSTDPTLRSLLIKIISELCLLKSQVNSNNQNFEF